MPCNWTPILNPFTGRLQVIGQVSGGGSGVVATPSIVLGKASDPSVADSTKTTILTITATVETYVTKIVVSGHDYAKWFLTLDTVDQNIKRNEYTGEWDFSSPWKLTAGQVLDIKVEHFLIGETLGFEATTWGYT